MSRVDVLHNSKNLVAPALTSRPLGCFPLARRRFSPDHTEQLGYPCPHDPRGSAAQGRHLTTCKRFMRIRNIWTRHATRQGPAATQANALPDTW